MATSIVNSTDTAAAAVALQAQKSAAESAASSKGMMDRFMLLLTTQMRNQDPLNPLDNAALTSQLAQISTLEGIEKLNATVSSSLEAISGQIDYSQSVQAVNMIGKEVLIPGSKIALGTDPANPEVRGATPFGVDLQTAAASVTVKINDANGNTLRTLTLQNQTLGIMGLEWDGKTDDGVAAPDGAYTVAVSAADAAGNALTALTPLTYGRVGSVGYTTQGVRLDLGLAGQIGMLDVRKIFNS